MNKEIKIIFEVPNWTTENSLINFIKDKINIDDTYITNIKLEEDDECTIMNNKWIPFSERPPKKEGYYFVTAKSCIDNKIGIKIMKFYNEGVGVWKDTYTNALNYEVLAWMELPEPYKEPNRDINVIFEVSDDITDERFLHALQFRLKEHANKIKIKSINNKEFTYTGVLY